MHADYGQAAQPPDPSPPPRWLEHAEPLPAQSRYVAGGLEGGLEERGTWGGDLVASWVVVVLHKP